MNGRRNKPDRRRKPERDPGQEYIRRVCALYNDRYDDREEDSRPGGESWAPGKLALHTSLESFRRELEKDHGIRLSTAKIRTEPGGRKTVRAVRERQPGGGGTGTVRRTGDDIPAVPAHGIRPGGKKRERTADRPLARKEE